MQMHTREPIDDLGVSYSITDANSETLTMYRDREWARVVDNFKNVRAEISPESLPLFSFSEYGELRKKSGLRHAANVVRVFGVEARYDGEKVTPEAVIEKLRAANIRALVFATKHHSVEAPYSCVIAPFGDPEIPEKRREYLGRINTIMGGILKPESFELAHAVLVGRIVAREYQCLVSEGRCIDTAFEIEPTFLDGGK